MSGASTSPSGAHTVDSFTPSWHLRNHHEELHLRMPCGGSRPFALQQLRPGGSVGRIPTKTPLFVVWPPLVQLLEGFFASPNVFLAFFNQYVQKRGLESSGPLNGDNTIYRGMECCWDHVVILLCALSQIMSENRPFRRHGWFVSRKEGLQGNVFDPASVGYGLEAAVQELPVVGTHSNWWATRVYLGCKQAYCSGTA